MRRRDAIAVIGAALGLLGCGGKTYLWNQKMTLRVMTPEGEKTGFGITQVGMAFNEDRWGPNLAGANYGAWLKGEAAFVEVKPGKFLFALLEERYQTLALKTFIGDSSWATPTKADTEKLEQIRAKKHVAREDYPLLVTFTDIKNPKTVKEVKPGKLDEAFGDGVYLWEIALEITDEKVPEDKVKSILSWIGDRDVMENPGWSKIPLDARRAIGGLLTDFKRAQIK